MGVKWLAESKRVVKSTSAISGIHIWRLKGYGNCGRHEPVGLVCRAEYVMSKAATSALGAGSLEWLNSAAQSSYASGSLVAAANRGCASTACSGGSYAASVLIKINAPICNDQRQSNGPAKPKGPAQGIPLNEAHDNGAAENRDGGQPNYDLAKPTHLPRGQRSTRPASRSTRFRRKGR
jgi:hypothetical protein